MFKELVGRSGFFFFFFFLEVFSEWIGKLDFIRCDIQYQHTRTKHFGCEISQHEDRLELPNLSEK